MGITQKVAIGISVPYEQFAVSSALMTQSRPKRRNIVRLRREAEQCEKLWSEAEQCAAALRGKAEQPSNALGYGVGEQGIEP